MAKTPQYITCYGPSVKEIQREAIGPGHSSRGIQARFHDNIKDAQKYCDGLAEQMIFEIKLISTSKLITTFENAENDN